MAAHRTFHFSNHLLDALPEDEANELSFEVDIVQLFEGQLIGTHKTPHRDVYFPTTAVIAFESTLPAGGRRRIATIACEGMTPLCSMPNGDDMAAPERLEVVRSGFAYRLSGAKLQEWSARASHRHLLLKIYAKALCTQANANAAPAHLRKSAWMVNLTGR